MKITNATLKVKSQTHERIYTTLLNLCNAHNTSNIKLGLRSTCQGGKTLKNGNYVIIIKVR